LPETQGQDSLPGILAEIVATKRAELQGLRHRQRELEAALDLAPACRDFAGSLGRPGSVSLIAECKRRSPGAGAIRAGLDPSQLTASYERAGASALSVLTDESFFGGTLADLTAVRGATSLPALRKDFTLDPLHVVEARGAGADAVLLIVRILDDAALGSLHAEAEGLGMAVLVEVHDEVELERALRIGAGVIGINNRDLATFTTDLRTTVRLLGGVPDDFVVVSESGVRTRSEVEWLGEAGVDAILVGETLLRAEDPEEAARSLVGVSTRARPVGPGRRPATPPRGTLHP
jgi:indole-3-glycerol phosphate synthase